MTLLIASFILGLTASLHCMGMCGPLAMAIPVNRSSTWTSLVGILQYNSGRILTYSGLGALVGIIGITIETFGVLQWISIFSGVAMIIYAWRKWLLKAVETKIPMLGMDRFVSKNIGKVLRSNSPFKIFFLGTLNGLLPCGMVYLALMNAILGGNALSSALSMTFFGLGTLPAMMLVAFSASRISSQLRFQFNKVVPYLLTLVGLLIILRGMNLGIPYVSPKISMISTTISSQKTPSDQKMEMSCCHQKEACEKK